MSTTEKTGAGRPRLFDEQAVLAALTDLFWRQGYGQTSMADVVEASGVHKPSLYRTFGTKEEIFAAVLRRYIAERIARFGALIQDAGPGVAGVHEFLDYFERDSLTERGRDGCLMVMASNELRGPLPGYDFAADFRQQMQDIIGALMAKAAADRAVGEDVLQARTDLLTTYLLGMQVVLRSGADEPTVRRYLNAMHVTVDSW